MQHLRQKGSLSLLAATLTKNIPGGEGGSKSTVPLSLASNFCPPTSKAPAMTRQHNTDNGDFSSTRPSVLLCPWLTLHSSCEFLIMLEKPSNPLEDAQEHRFGAPS